MDSGIRPRHPGGCGGRTELVVAAASKPSQPKAPAIIAHRAGAHHAPENTLAALEIAVRQKADSAEIDVQRTLDGTVVVVHDQDLMKSARDPRRIGQTTYRDLSQVDIGSLFHPDF